VSSQQIHGRVSEKSARKKKALKKHREAGNHPPPLVARRLMHGMPYHRPLKKHSLSFPLKTSQTMRFEFIVIFFLLNWSKYYIQDLSFYINVGVLMVLLLFCSLLFCCFLLSYSVIFSILVSF